MRWFVPSLIACALAPCTFAAEPPHDHQHPAPAPGSLKPASGGIVDVSLAAPVGFEKVDATITIGVVPGQMKYDRDEFNVAPGAKVKITFVNKDLMQHNLVLCKAERNVTQTVANAALALGAEGFAKGFVPDSELILAHTKLLDPNQSQSIYITAPKQSGSYPYVCTMPGHQFTMTGVMTVGSGFDGVGKNHGGVDDLVYKYYEAHFDKLPDFTKLTPTKVGSAGNKIKVDPVRGKRREDYAFVWTGRFYSPIDEEYTFFLSSDDGSRLILDGKTVIDNDGPQNGEKELKQKIKLTQGDHRFELQYFQARGGSRIYLAYSGEYTTLKSLTPDTKSNVPDPRFEITVTDKPMLKRGIMPDGSTRCIAVGLPVGTSYCFDAQTCAVLYGWTGKFLSAAPDLGNGSGRGGGTNTVLGQRFKVNASGKCPLRIGGSRAEPSVQFRGYRTLGDAPEFLFVVDGYEVAEKITPAPDGQRGLTLTFTFDRRPDGGVMYDHDSGEVMASPAYRLGQGLAGITGTLLPVSQDGGRTYSITLIATTKQK
jgi:azurin